MNQDIFKRLKHIPELSNIDILKAFSLEQDTLYAHFPIEHIKEALNEQLQNTRLEQNILRHSTKLKPNPKIKNIIAIASGKGGVGKSTVTYFLAHALKHCGANVGILDADIYGPSQTFMFDLNSKPLLSPSKKMIPFEKQGIHIMSIGSLIDEKKALMWRGPMISQALLQLYQQTDWPDLDYLLVDLPPGTGDIPLTLIQKIPVTTSVLVTLPHKLSHYDVNKCKTLFNHLELPILGTITNQAYQSCPQCDSTIFESLDAPSSFFKIPLDAKLQSIKATAHPEFIDLAQSLSTKLLEYSVHKDNPFANISIELQSGEEHERKS